MDSGVDPTILLNDYSTTCAHCDCELKAKAGNEQEGNQKLQTLLAQHIQEKHNKT